MMKIQHLYFLLPVLLFGCSMAKIPGSEKGLKDHYADYFPIGVAVSPQALRTDEAALVRKEFNSLTAENAMKMGPVHPRENQFNWSGGDSIAAFARKHNMKMRGHVLVWHKQAPKWFFTDAKGDTVSREVLMSRIKHHITEVVSHFKGKVYAWDVLNEVISDNPGEQFHNTAFIRICGEGFIDSAFAWAHAADPEALLFYNDYNEIDPVKRKKIIQMIGSLKAKGIPVHGIGLQGHWAIMEPTREQLEQTLADFSNLGLQIHITELDVSVYRKEHEARTQTAADQDTAYTAEKARQQSDFYKMAFELFRKYRRAITSVTFWNISDRYTWLSNFPVQGRTDYPLLFDKDLKRKPAYWEVVNF